MRYIIKFCTENFDYFIFCKELLFKMDLKNLFGLKKPDIKKMEMERDIEGLTRLLKFENDESVRRDAAFAIGKIIGPNSDIDNGMKSTEDREGSVEDLIESLKSDDINGQKSSARKLVDIGKPVVNPVIKALNDDKWRVRWYAAEILGEIGDKSAVNPLIKSLKDENNGVRSNAIIALVNIGDESVKPLIISLDDESWQVRWHAAEALGEIKNKNAVDPLIKTLSDKNSWVRKTAVTSLGMIGDKSAEKPLKNLLNDEDPEVREAAHLALEKMN